MLNGQSAPSCWNCDANFLVTRPFGARAAPAPTVLSVEPSRRGLHLVEPQEVQAWAAARAGTAEEKARSVAPGFDPDATVPVPLPPVHSLFSGVDLALPMRQSAEADAALFARPPQRYRLDLIAAVIAVALMGFGAYLLSGSGSTATVEATTTPPITAVPPVVRGPAAVARPTPAPDLAADAAPAAGEAKHERLPIWPPYPCTPPVAATGLCKMEPGAAK